MEVDPVEVARRELYAAPPEEFVARRAALVKQARAEKDKERATAIGAIRKPSKSASLLNRFAVAHPDRVQELLDLGASLRRAERELDATTLRALTQRRRALIGALGIEIDPQASGGVAEEVSATLNAALADDAVAADLQQGTLGAAAEWDGFGLGGPALAVLPGGRSSAAGPDPSAATSTPRGKTETAATTTQRDTTTTPTPGQTTTTAIPTRRETARATAARAERERMRAEADQARVRLEQTRSRARTEADRAAKAVTEAERAEAEAAERVQQIQQDIDRLTDELEQQTAGLKVAQSEWRQTQSALRAAKLLAQRTSART